MNAHSECEGSFRDQDAGPPVTEATTPAPPSESVHLDSKMGIGQKAVVALLLTVVLVPPTAAFYSYFSGVPLHLLASSNSEEKGASEASAPASVALVAGQAHTLQVPAEVSAALGIRKGEHDAIVVAQAPTKMRPLSLPGSTALRSHAARPRPRLLRAGPGGRIGENLGSLSQNRTYGIPRTEAR